MSHRFHRSLRWHRFRVVHKKLNSFLLLFRWWVSTNTDGCWNSDSTFLAALVGFVVSVPDGYEFWSFPFLKISPIRYLFLFFGCNYARAVWPDKPCFKTLQVTLVYKPCPWTGMPSVMVKPRGRYLHRQLPFCVGRKSRWYKMILTSAPVDFTASATVLKQTGFSRCCVPPLPGRVTPPTTCHTVFRHLCSVECTFCTGESLYNVFGILIN